MAWFVALVGFHLQRPSVPLVLGLVEDAESFKGLYAKEIPPVSQNEQMISSRWCSVKESGMRSDVPQERGANTAEEPISAVSILFNGNPLAIWIYDAVTLQLLDANESALKQYRYSREDFLQLKLDDLVLSGSGKGEGGGRGSKDCSDNEVQRHLRSDGTQMNVAVRSNELCHLGRPCKLVIAEDITERWHVNAELIQMAHHDGLTGLPNRTLLGDRMSQAMTTAQRLGHRTAVICVDLDDFKKVNDWYGHAVGDEHLKHVAGLLTSRLRGMDTVARLGGDEFAIVLGEISSLESAGLVGKMLLQTLNKPAVTTTPTLMVTRSRICTSRLTIWPCWRAR